MKVSKEGKVVVTGADRRVGNFVWSNYSDYVAFTDINRTVQTKVSKRTLVGQMLERAIREKSDTFLHNYAGVLYYLNGLAPDREFIEEAFKAAQACLERHPELYGRGDVTDAEDAEVIREARELSEFEEGVRNLPEDEEEAD